MKINNPIIHGLILLRIVCLVDTLLVHSLFFYFILLNFHCTKYIYYMYNEASLQQVHTQQGKLQNYFVLPVFRLYTAQLYQNIECKE